jgi:hypothetical protein
MPQLKISKVIRYLLNDKSKTINALLLIFLSFLCAQFIDLRGTGDVTKAFVPWIDSALESGFLENYQDRVTAYPPGYIAIPYGISKFLGINSFWAYKIFLLLSILLAVICCTKFLSLRGGLVLGIVLVYPALVLGYGDSLLIAILILILMSLESNKFFTSGLFLGLLICVKFTPLMLIPIIIIYSFRKENELSRGILRRIRIRNLVKILAGALVWLIPVTYFTGLQMFINNLKLALLNGYLSGNAPNLGWIITKFQMGESSIPQYNENEQLIRFVYVDVHSSLYTVMKLLAMIVIVLLILKSTRRSNNLNNLALVICLVIFVYYEFAPGVHENHLTLAIPFAIILIYSKDRTKMIFGTYIIFISLLNLFSFYSFNGSYNELRIIFGTDITLILALIELSSAIFLTSKYLFGKPRNLS